jgi:6-phosphofructokinase 2
MSDILTVTMNPALDVSVRTGHLLPTRKLRCDQVERHPGGGGINVARVLHRLGADCAALCLLGGPSGQMVAQLLADEGVPCIPVLIAGHTRESFTVQESASQQEYRFVLPGPNIAPQEVEAFVSALVQQPAPRFLVASGSLPPGVPADFYVRLATSALAKGAKLVVDGSGAALGACLDHGVYMVKPSLREMRELTGLALVTLQEVRAAAMDWVTRGRAQVVAVSLGHQGAVMASAQAVWFAPPLPVTVVSAVGAGDSFVAGVVWALSQGHALDRAFAYGVAAGSAALSSTGTGLCAPQDVHTGVQSVTLLSEFPELVL